MKKLAFTIFTILLTVTSFAQKDTTCWKGSIKYHEQNFYILATPYSWREVDLSDNSEFKYKFELTGQCLPGQVNNVPVVGFATFQEFDGEISPDSVLAGERNKLLLLKDRVIEASLPDFDTMQLAIASKENGIMMHTKYYRRVKVQNYSSYFFVVKNEKRNKTYLYHLQITYKDPTYKFEYNEKLKDYAIRLFSKIKMR